MSEEQTRRLTRRDFLKVSAAGLAAAAGVRGLTRQANAAAPPVPFESRFTACDMCFNRCGAIARVRSGVVEKLDPNPKFTKSRGMLCGRGQAGVAQLYDPDRLKHPLVRVGERGEGKFRRISWDEALDLAAARFKEIAARYTRCGVLFSAGSDMQSQFVNRFAEAFGSYNVTSHESLCLVSVNRAFLDTFGEVPFADVLKSRYVILAGANRLESLVTPDSIDLVAATRRGCKVVVLDPRYTKTAARATEWHAVRPGTDMAFMLALLHVIVGEKLYDAQFVARKTFGIERLAEHVRPYSPRWAAAECGVPAEDIARIARELAAAAPEAMVYPGRRSSDYGNSTQVRRSFALVNALLGNWDRPGGLLPARQVGLKKPGFDPPWYDDNPPARVDAKAAPLIFEDEGSFVLTREAVIRGEPYPVKGWFVYKTNPMQTAPERKKTMQMISKLDFIVAVDIALSDTAFMADLVLPAQSYLERLDPAQALQGSSACACVVARDPVVPALYESRSVFDVFKGLAKRLDLGQFFDFDVAAFRDQQLAGLPEAKAALARDGVYYNPSRLYGIYDDKPQKTKSGKIELYCQRYAELGLDPLPVYVPPKPVPQDRFRLVVGRNALVTQTSSQNNALLNELVPTNTLWIHPAAAKRLNVAHGDTVTVRSPAGSGELAAELTRAIREDTVYMLSGFGTLSNGLSLIRGKGASVAELVESRHDAISGNAAMHETFVTVTRKGG